MTKYAITRDVKRWTNVENLGLKCHGITGKAIEYSPDKMLKMLSAAMRNKNSFILLFDTLADAEKARFEYGDSIQPIFEINTKEDALISPCSTYQVTTAENIRTVSSAIHGKKVYCLSETYKYYDLFHYCISRLLNISTKVDFNEDIKQHICNLKELVLGLESELTYKELVTILEPTNKFLTQSMKLYYDKFSNGTDPTTHNNEVKTLINQYQAFVKTQQTALSPAVQAFGLCMLALVTALILFLAPGWGIIPGVSIGLAGIGLFAFCGSYPKNNLSTNMDNLSKSVENFCLL